MKKIFVIAILFFGAVFGAVYGAQKEVIVPNPNLVPDASAVKILQIELDEAKLSADGERLQKEYNADQQSFIQDANQLTVVEQEALKVAQKDDTWEIDLASRPLVFAEKKKPVITAAPASATPPAPVPTPASAAPETPAK